jgi:hypothetical protein
MSALLLAATFAGMITIHPPSYTAERIALVLTATADVITTRAAIRNGAIEGNPLLTPLVGKTPSTLKLIAVKAASMALIEAIARWHARNGRYALAKFTYHLAAWSWGYAAGFNLRLVVR